MIVNVNTLTDTHPTPSPQPLSPHPLIRTCQSYCGLWAPTRVMSLIGAVRPLGAPCGLEQKVRPVKLQVGWLVTGDLKIVWRAIELEKVDSLVVESHPCPPRHLVRFSFPGVGPHYSPCFPPALSWKSPGERNVLLPLSPPRSAKLSHGGGHGSVFTWGSRHLVGRVPMVSRIYPR